MGGGAEQDRGSLVPLSVEQIFELIEAAVADSPRVSLAALLCRIERLLLQGTGATGVNAFLVDRHFNKLFHFSTARDGTGRRAFEDTTVGVEDLEQQQQQQQQQQETTFETRAVCDIGNGVAGTAALTGRKLRVRDCSKPWRQPPCSTDRDSGSLICWPVREPPWNSYESGDGGRMAPAPSPPRDSNAADFLEDVDSDGVVDLEGSYRGSCRDSSGGTVAERAVLAVLQVHSVDCQLSREAIEMIGDVGRLLMPLLSDTLASEEERVSRRSVEALYSLTQIVPRETGIIALVEEVVSVAEFLTEAERVCLFFVDDVAEELWVAKSVDFDDAKIKIGHGLCGYAVATGETVNVIDCYEDSRFDSRWDKQTGFVTKSVLCVPIPPPDCMPYVAPRRMVGGRWGDMHGLRRAGSAFLEDRDAPCQPPDEVFGARTPSPHALSPPPPPSQRRRQEASRAGACKEASGSYPPRQSRTRPRPIAVVEVMNKRGGGVFNEHDEEALLRVCACVESLLRRKAAEVALLKSGMTERSCRNNGSCGGGGSDADGAASSNRARVESTIMRLYSEYVSVDAILSEEGEQQAPKKMKGAAGGDDGMGGSSGGNGSSKGASGGGRAEVDDFTGEENMTEIESGFASPSGQDGGDDSGRRARDGRWTPAVEGDAAVGNRTHGGDEGSAVSTGGVEGPNGGVCRQRAGIQYNPEEDAELMNLNTNLFEMSTVQQLSLMERFFRSMGLTEHFHISDQKLRSFLQGAERRYHPNPFHNLTHAVSVAHAAFTVVKTTRVNSLLRPLDKLGLLIAAFCHDIDHPGNNNDYEINSFSPLALQHSDSSVLERHHVFVTYQVLLQEGGANNIMSELTRSQFREVRQTIVQAILATDMSRHMQHCAEVSQFAQRAKSLRAGVDGGAAGTSSIGRQGKEGGRLSPVRVPRRTSIGFGGKGERGRVAGAVEEALKGSPPRRSLNAAEEATATSPSAKRLKLKGRWTDEEDEPRDLFSVDKAEDRSFLTKTIIHCADLSGQVLEHHFAREWGRRILEEFRTQAELEAKEGLPLTTLATGDMETTMKGQHFFVARIVKPLWEPFVALFPELDPLLVNLNNNGALYKAEASRLEKERLSRGKLSPSSPSPTPSQLPHREGRRDGDEATERAFR